MALGFCLDHRDILGTGLHQFVLGQHTSAVQKVLKARSDQHQVIPGGGAAPSLVDSATLTVPNGVYFLATMAMARGDHKRLRVVLVTLVGQEHPIALAMRDINAKLLERETNLEECNSCDRGVKDRIPAAINRWVHIHL